jgi:ribonucleoside-diphosphate reductase alpha chain
MNKDDALAVYLKNVIPDLVEDDKMGSGVVVSIPQESPKGSLVRSNETALTAFNRAVLYNKHWVANGHVSGDNMHNVSVTISVKEEEWDELREAMWNSRGDYYGVSLLPYDGGTYVQAPFEECNQETFTAMEELIKNIDLKHVREEQDNTNRIEQLACVGGVCEINI